MYKYKAKPDSRKYENGVYDGDTIRLIIDVGFDITVAKTIRLLNVNTPEVRGPSRTEGLRFKSLTQQWMLVLDDVEWPLIITTEKDDSFGRYLAIVNSTIRETSLNDYLLRHGSPRYEK